jgi:hypothetical protein
MYKVKFENGYTLNFEEEPTQEMIDEAASFIPKDDSTTPTAPVNQAPTQDPMRKGPVGKVLGAGSDFLGDVARAPVRAVASAGLDLAAGVTGLATGKNVRAEYQPTGALQQALLGKDSIKGMGLKAQESVAKDTAGSKDPLKALGAINKATFLGTASEALDLLPLAGGKAKSVVGAIEKKGGEVLANMATKKGVSRIKALEDIISPDLTKKVREEALGRGEKLSAKEISALSPEEKIAYEQIKTGGVKTTGKGVFTKTQYESSPEVKDIATRIKDAGIALKTKASEQGKNITKLKIAGKKMFNETTDTIKNYVDGLGSEYKPLDSDKIVETLDSNLAKTKALPQRTIDLSTDTEKTYDKIWEIAKESLKKNVTKTGEITQEGILKALRDWNSKASEVAAFEGKENIKKVAIKDVRQILRDTLVETLPKAKAKVVDNLLKNQHAFIDAIENIKTKNNLLLKSKSTAERFVGGVKKALPAAIGAGVIGTGIGAALNK